tara:strand:- start:374 stop:640 length:267 start_codon:yes stop_codon:yes gene_type:complete
VKEIQDNSNWIQTDASTGQFGRRISKNEFEFREIRWIGLQYVIVQETINLANYSGKEIDDVMSSYYSPKDTEQLSNWVIAKCVFETLC